MLFNKAIFILAISSIKRGTVAATKEEQRLRGMNTIVDANNDEVKKYVATNPDGIFPLNEESSILNDDSKPEVKIATQAQIDAFEEAVRQYHDRPIEFIPRTEAGTTYGGVDLMDRMKKSEKESFASTSTMTTPFPFHLRSESKVGDVSCGGHRGATCAACPIDSNGNNNGQGWCNGDCTWDTASGTCNDVTQKVVCNVICGGHCAENCAACPMGNGAGWCNGECTWNTPTSTCIDKPAKVCNAAGTVKAATCSDCAFADCTSSQCEKMPAYTLGASPGDCRYVLDDTDARSASTFFNYNVPSGVSKPAWWFNKLDIVDASTATFYSTNGHRFGYAGFQVSETKPYQGRVLFSIWDQGGCDKERNGSNCPANQVAKTVACGTGIKCTDFGGEGTGRKSIVYSDDLPLLEEPYYIVTWARSVGAGTYRMQYSTFFYVPGNKNWDSSATGTGSSYTPTPPGWRFLSTIEVGTDANEVWYMADLNSFLEQWTGQKGLDKRSGLYGPSFLAGETGDFVQINDCYFRHGSIENYKHVNAFNDAATGALGMEMGESVTRKAYNNQLFKFPTASKPAELESFIPIKECLSGLPMSFTTDQVNGCLTAGAATPACLVKKVKIQGTTNEPLNIVEVKVFSDGGDVAPRGTATQSSTFTSSNGPDKAIDNNSGTFSHTAVISSPAWWEVSLASAVSVQSIEIVNRSGRSPVLLCRMSKANLILYDQNNQLVYNKNLGDTCNRQKISEAVTCSKM